MICSMKKCERTTKARGYCAYHYNLLLKNGAIETKGKRDKIEFEIDHNGCFNCTSHFKSKNGYFAITRNRNRTYIHRFVYEEMFGLIPEGMVIRHKCDNPSCINPEHLELGTQIDNIKDMIDRGRSKKTKVIGKSLDGKMTIELERVKDGISFGFTPQNISKCCRGGIKYHKGFIWNYA